MAHSKLRRVSWIGTLATVLAAGISQAQPDAPAGSASQASEEAIKRIYAKTQQAKTLIEFAEIIELCDQARRETLSPAHQDYTQKLSSWAHNRRGELYAQEAATLHGSGQADRSSKAEQLALAEFETSIQLDPNYWKALHNRGVSYGLLRRFTEAIGDFTRVVELRPAHANAWFNRAEIYFDRGQYREALGDYDHVVRLKADDAEAYLHRGHARFQLDQFREALADYNRALELAPNNADMLAARGDAYRCLGDLGKADAEYRRALSLGGKSARAYQSAAWFLATSADPRFRKDQQALEYAQKALELSREPDHQLLETLAAAYANAGDFERAKEQQQAAIGRAPATRTAALRARLELYQQQKAYRETRMVGGRSGESGGAKPRPQPRPSY